MILERLQNSVSVPLRPITKVRLDGNRHVVAGKPRHLDACSSSTPPRLDLLHRRFAAIDVFVEGFIWKVCLLNSVSFYTSGMKSQGSCARTLLIPSMSCTQDHSWWSFSYLLTVDFEYTYDQDPGHVQPFCFRFRLDPGACCLVSSMPFLVCVSFELAPAFSPTSAADFSFSFFSSAL